MDIDKFLESVTDEHGNKIDFSDIEIEGFSGVLCIVNNCADVHISINNFEVYNNDLTEEENRMLFEFAMYTQRKMKEYKQFLQDDINTKKNLYNYGKF